MWSACLVFCDCGFHSGHHLMDEDKRLIELPVGRDWLWGNWVLFRWGVGHVQQIFNPIFCWWARLCSLPVVWPDYGGGNEDNGDCLQKVLCTDCCTQCPWPCSRPPLTHASARGSWTLTGNSGSVSCGITAPFSWVLVRKSFSLCSPRVCFPSPV